MRIFVNCSNLFFGGGLSVGLGVVNALYQLKSCDNFVVFIPNTDEYSNYKTIDNIKIIRNTSNNFISKLILEWKLSKLVRGEKCDAILSLSNYAIPSELPQSLMLHWPYAVYPEQEIWQKMSFVNKLKRKFRLLKLRYLLPYSNQLIVQTDVMKKRAQSYLVPKKKVVVIPSSIGFLGDDENFEIIDKIKLIKESGSKVFLCINEYYEHKNLEILIPLAKDIEKKSLKIKFLVTLQNDNEFAKMIIKLNLQNTIINIGRVKRIETKSIFKSCDALFFPSLIESFGIPLIEAQYVNLPIYTSDRDFAHAICGDNAVYFDPNSLEDILEKIQIDEPFKTKIQLFDWNSITLKMIDTLK